MAIKSNKKIDFEYEHDNDGNTYSILLRLYNDGNYGASIGLLDENGDVAVAFPVQMFGEIHEFLIEQGVIEDKKQIIAQPVKLPKVNKSPATAKPLVLPKPRLVSTKNNTTTSKNMDVSSRNPIPVDLENDKETVSEFDLLPIELQEQLQAERERIANLHSAIDDLSPTLSLSENVEQENLDDEELKIIMQEREAAMKRAKSSDRKIKKT